MPTIYRTVGGWGAGKGSNLTPAEVDENFFGHEGRIGSIETNPPQPNEITNIFVNGQQMTVFMGDGTSFGPFTLPTAMIRFRGEWTGSTTYFVLDLVSVAGEGLFIVNSQHVSEEDTTGQFDITAEDSNGLLYSQVLGPIPIGSLDESEDVEYDSGGVNDCDVLVRDGIQWVTGPAPAPKIIDVSTTTLELAAIHSNKHLRCTNVGGCEIILPDSADTIFKAATEFHMTQRAVLPITFNFSSGVQFNGITGFENQSAVEGAVMTLKYIGSDEWDLWGFLAEETT